MNWSFCYIRTLSACICYVNEWLKTASRQRVGHTETNGAVDPSLHLCFNVLFSDASGSSLMLLLVNLLFNDAALLRSCLSTYQGGVTIKVTGNFFERRVLSFNVEEVNEHELESEPDALQNMLAIDGLQIMGRLVVGRT